MNATEALKTGASLFLVELSPQLLEKFQVYSDFLIEYNEKVNLTAIVEPEQIAIRHFVDSLAILGLWEIPQNASLVDVGTGAGFPGIPLKMVRGDIKLTLLDSLQKRLVFLDELNTKLAIKAQSLHFRAETAGADPKLRERFDVATSRAVGSMAVLCEYCLPLLKVGGSMIAMKGPDCKEELLAAHNAIKVLGGGEPSTKEYLLPDGSGRTLIVIKKVAPTPKKYPRQRVNLNEKPL